MSATSEIRQALERTSIVLSQVVQTLARNDDLPDDLTDELEAAYLEGCSALVAPEGEPADWRVEAARWLRWRAAGQACANATWPDHTQAYPQWESRARDTARLAAELEDAVWRDSMPKGRLVRVLKFDPPITVRSGESLVIDEHGQARVVPAAAGGEGGAL